MDEFYKITAYILAGILGLCVGSFLNVVIHRLPRGMRLDRPASHCPGCGYQLRWYDNIPVISYLILGGRCRSCRTHISFRYTAVELLNTALWLLSIWAFWDDSIPFACISAVAASLLLTVAFIDLEHMVVFDRFHVMLGVLGVAAVFTDPEYGWLSHLIGAGAGFLVFFGVAAFFYYCLHRDALGGGDIKLAAVAGLLLGWERLLLAVLIASFSASLVLPILARRARGEETPESGEAEPVDGEEGSEEETEEEAGPGEFPFCPFLVVGFLVALYFGAPIIEAYLSLFGL